jgi:hypothetical protein
MTRQWVNLWDEVNRVGRNNDEPSVRMDGQRVLSWDGWRNLLRLDFMIGVIYIMAQVSQLRLYNLLFTYPSMLIS